MRIFVLAGVLVVALAPPMAWAGADKLAGTSMPSRLSMTPTTARQSQGATFGEKVGSGLQTGANALAQGARSGSIEIACGGDACVVEFPDGGGFRADLAQLRLAPLDDAGRQEMRHWGDPHENPNGKRSGQAAPVGQGASLVGGAMPGAGIVSAAVSSIGAMASGGGAASASYAATGRAAVPASSGGDAQDAGTATEPLDDGQYELVLVVEKAVEMATKGLKDTLKTNVRTAAPPQPRQVRIVLGFDVQDGLLKTRHDTQKNSISNVR